MRTSRRMLKEVRRALLAAFVLSGCINVLMLAMPLYTLQVFETVVPTGSVETLVLLSAMVAAALFALALIEIARDAILLRAGLWLDHSLGQHMIENGLKLAREPADLRQDARALAQFRSFLTSPQIGPVFDAPWVPLFLLALLLMHPLIAGVAAVAAIALFIASLSQALLTSRAQVESQQAAERAEHWWQTVSVNASTAGALGLARGAAEQWELYNRAHVAGAYSAGKRTSAVKAFARLVRIAAQVGVYGIGAFLVIRGEVSPGVLVASAILLGRALAPLEQSVLAFRTFGAALGAYRRLKALPADAVVPRVGAGDAAPVGRIVLGDVTVYRAGHRSPTLRSVSLTLEPGQSLGIVGPNGAGKSTLAAVLAGAVAPTSGAADLDGVPIVKWQRGEGAPPIGYLPDEPTLVEGSVHANIARFSDDSLVSVARSAMRAGVHETLSSLQSGYDTMLGPGGGGLSLRERRAVALARAIHGAPRLVVLDEPEIGLDGASLRKLMKVLDGLKAEGVALVVATQDPRLLALVDVVVVLNGGAVQSVGTGRDLAERLRAGRPAPGAAEPIAQGVH